MATAKFSAKKKRVVVYLRTATTQNDGSDNFEARVERIKKKIAEQHPDWTIVGVYGDKGVSGSSKNRPEYGKMTMDAQKGGFDAIVTESIPMFMRNTAEFIEDTRKLKSVGVEVYFSRESLSTTDNEAICVIVT